jgi:hypothetical protein
VNRGELLLILLLVAPVLIRIAEESHYAGLERERDRVMAAWERGEAARRHRWHLAEIEYATQKTVAHLEDIADAEGVVIEGERRMLSPAREAKD